MSDGGQVTVQNTDGSENGLVLVVLLFMQSEDEIDRPNAALSTLPHGRIVRREVVVHSVLLLVL